jgi:hypothetical protein
VGLFAREGYAVRVVVLAVAGAVSRLGVLVRYWGRLPESGPGWGLPVRLTPRVVHEGSFGGVGRGVGWVDFGEWKEGGGGDDGDQGGGDDNGDGQWDARAVDRIVVLRRNGGVVYANERAGEDREWAREAGALRALERERARGLSEDEKKVVEADLQMLRGLGNPKVDKEVAEIEGLLAGLKVGDDAAYPDVVPLDAHDFIWRGVA